MASGLKGMLLRKGADMLMKKFGGSHRSGYNDRSYGASRTGYRTSRRQDLMGQAMRLFGEFNRNRRRPY